MRKYKRADYYCFDCGNNWRDTNDNRYTYCPECGCEHDKKIIEEFDDEEEELRNEKN